MRLSTYHCGWFRGTGPFLGFLDMDYPSGEPAGSAVFAFRGEDADSPWNPAFTFDAFFDSVFPPSYAVQGQCDRGGIDLIFSPSRDGDTGWPVPGTNETEVPVSPSALSDFARLYVANWSCDSAARSQRTYMPKQQSFSGIHAAGVIDPAPRELRFVNSKPSPPCHVPQTQLPHNPINTDSPPFPAFPYDTSFDPVLTSPTAGSQWTCTSVGSDQVPGSTKSSRFLLAPCGLDATLDTFGHEENSGLPSIHCRVPVLPESHYASSSNSVVSPEAASSDHGRRASTVSTDATVPDATVRASSTSPSPRRRKRASTSPPISLAIVQYKPTGGPEGRSSRKRLAFEGTTPQGMASQTLRQISWKDENGEVQCTMMTFGKRIQTRSAFSEEKRLQTARARREGVCGRCRKSKRQCDLAQKDSPYVSCSLCKTTRIYKGVPRMPCFKSTLADILLFRSGPASNEPLFTTRRTVYDLGDPSMPNAPVRSLKLTQHIGSHYLTVYASEFTPSPGDVISYKWKDVSGKDHELRMPTFCLTNIEKVCTHFRDYIDSAKWSYLKSLESEDELAWMTVSMAMEYAKSRSDSLVADTLSLWAISRIIEIPWEMFGTDTLDVMPVSDPGSPHYGKIPVPPIMDTQLDQIVIQLVLKPLRARVIQKLEQLITPAKPEMWFEIYLSAFILLNHIERLAKHSVVHAETHCMPTKYSNTDFLEGAFHTAKCILARFHFVCNGSAPLRLDWRSPKVAAMAKLEADQVEYMKKMQAMVSRRESDIISLRVSHKYEYPLYWTGQLFLDEFDTSPVHVAEMPRELNVKHEIHQ
ncbi:hypothetical protein VTK56DRAFT_8395 [Thermocarpiscus australiensis]